MTRCIALLTILAVNGLVSTLSAQITSDQRAALIVAFKHVRSTIPSGVTAIEVDRLPAGVDAPPIAAAVGSEARLRANTFMCDGLAVSGPKNCSLRGIVGSLGYERMSIQGDSGRVVIWRRVQVSNRGRTWIHHQ
jgi:hypothetical protein